MRLLSPFPNAALVSCTLAVLLTARPLEARPAHKKALADHLGSFLPKKLNTCTLCHLPEKPGAAADESDKPHNAFGARLAAVKKELSKTGKNSDLISRFEAIANEDADGDGAPNLVEILTGHFPGDARDTPGKDEVAAAAKLLLALRTKQKDYPWRPFETVQRPALPAVKNSAAHNPIDIYLAAAQEKQRLKPRPEAAPHVLVRRLYLDLIGLPPTPQEIQAYTSDHAPAAYEKLVERLLASPHYGERWGRHWMDIWRYSDWAGYGKEVRDSQPHIWRWRDWIIESLNADKPYDRMVEEMLAGDELAPTDPGTLRATGYLVRNWYKFNRDVWLDRTVEHTAKAFLGITLNCARCHDHFFDPLAQKEYYQFRAFFEPHDIRVDPVPGQLDTAKAGLVRVFDAKLDAKTYLYIRGEDINPDKKNPLPPAVPAALGGKALAIAEFKLPAVAIAPGRQEWLLDEMVRASQAAVVKAKEKPNSALEAALAEAKHAALLAVLHAEKLEETQPKALAWEEAARSALKAQRQVSLLEAKQNLALAEKAVAEAKEPARAGAEKKVAESRSLLQKAELAAGQPLTTAYTRRALPTYPSTSTGRRLALARWIADRQNPLAARVAVNHLWLRHFGKALVSSVFDFGANGHPPDHPALLDWLAAEFMEPTIGSGPAWSMKRLHRLIVTSAAYRRDSNNDEASAARDPENSFYWRMNVRRMEAEIVRDSVLAVAGQLDRTFGGPELDQATGLTTKRRSIYYRYAPEKMMEFMTLFDSANVTECYQRTESVVPQQALALANSSLVMEQARLLARTLTKELGAKQTPPAFISGAFVRVLGRPPTPEELTACAQFLTRQAALLADTKTLTTFSGGTPTSVPPAADPQARARDGLVHVLLNHNEFLTIR